MNTLSAALWLNPAGPARPALEAAMERARALHGGPPFAPHLTLLGGLSIDPEGAAIRLRRLARQLQPFELVIEGIGRGDDPFRRLYARIRATPELQAARQCAAQEFGVAEGTFEPHISLLYGEPPLPTGACADGEALRDLRFEVESLQLVAASRQQPVAQWRRLAESTLGPETGIE